MSAEPLKDADRLDGVAHPRETLRLYGCDAAEQAFLDAWRSGRAHHAWMLRGPSGVGKASFAYRVARFVLDQPPAQTDGLFAAAEPPPPPDSLSVAPDRPAARQIAAGAHPGLRELRRGFNAKTGKFNKFIAVDDIRALQSLFQLSAADGGWRVALIDPAEDLNASAANALLKLLEEPPQRALFLIVASAPGRLPATIRSRCRALDFRPLRADDALAALRQAAPDIDKAEAATLLRLAPGAPGAALRLAEIGGAARYVEVLAVVSRLLENDLERAFRLMEAVRTPADLEQTGRMFDLALRRLALAGAFGGDLDAALGEGGGAIHPRESFLAARLSPDPAAGRVWAEAHRKAQAHVAESLALNIDPGRSILDTALQVRRIAVERLGAVPV